jgi:hypothetical protein
MGHWYQVVPIYKPAENTATPEADKLIEKRDIFGWKLDNLA